MFVALEARTSCWLCAYQYRVFRFSSVRINKHSLREQGTSIVTAGSRRCPECGELNIGDLIPVSAYRLFPEDEAKVIAYRERKWGVSDGTGPLVEAKQKHQRGEAA